MSKILTALLTILILMCVFATPQYAQAANHYVRADATGNNDGSDWTNAYPEMPTSWVRGDTYYIAGGTYAPPTAVADTLPVMYFNDYNFFQEPSNITGTGTIIIKKATRTDHGTDMGWRDTYAGQAILRNPTIGSLKQKATIYICASDIEIDGGELTGLANSSDHYGLVIKQPGDNPYGSPGALGDPDLAYYSGIAAVYAPGTARNNVTVNNIKFNRVAVMGPGEVSCIMLGLAGGFYYTCINGGIKSRPLPSNGIQVNNMTISNSYFEGNSQHIDLLYVKTVEIFGNYFADNPGSATGCHPEQLNFNTTQGALIYGNTFVNSYTFPIAIHQTDGYPATGIKIFNNLFLGPCKTTQVNHIAGSNNVNNPDPVWGAEFHHNVVANLKIGESGLFFPGTITELTDEKKAKVYNNLVYNSTNANLDNANATSGAIVHDHNAYLKSTGYTYAINNQIDDNAADPFIDSANGNFHLKSGALPINNGKTGLGTTYAYDFDGILRDARPDIGAYEYVEAADVTPPAAPTGLTIQ